MVAKAGGHFKSFQSGYVPPSAKLMRNKQGIILGNWLQDGKRLPGRADRPGQPRLSEGAQPYPTPYVVTLPSIAPSDLTIARPQLTVVASAGASL